MISAIAWYGAAKLYGVRLSWDGVRADDDESHHARRFASDGEADPCVADESRVDDPLVSHGDAREGKSSLRNFEMVVVPRSVLKGALAVVGHGRVEHDLPRLRVQRTPRRPMDLE